MFASRQLFKAADKAIRSFVPLVSPKPGLNSCRSNVACCRSL